MDHIREILDRYYKGISTPEEEKILVEYFVRCDVETGLHQYKTEFIAIDSLARLKFPSDKLNMVNQNQRSVNWRPAWGWLYKTAAAITLCFAGYLGGNFYPYMDQDISYLEAEVNRLKLTSALILLDKPLANERLLALQQLESIVKLEKDVVSSLLFILNSDPNENIRLASVAQLNRFSGDHNVRSELIGSLQNQDSPIVQLELLEVLLQEMTHEEQMDMKRSLDKAGMHAKVLERIISI